MSERIVTASDLYPVGAGAEAVHETWWAAMRPLDPFVLPTELAGSKAAVDARVNHGRWIVVCPDDGEGQVIDPADARFLCLRCLNAAVNGRWRPVNVPGQREGIEAALLEREHPVNRNWLPGETAQMLKDEKRLRGRTSIPTAADLDADTLERLYTAHEAFVADEDPAEDMPDVKWSPEGEALVTFPKKRRR